MKRLIAFLVFAMVSCNEPLETHHSPTGKYVLRIDLDRSVPNDFHLAFRIINKDGEESYYLKTQVGDHMKWAASWCNDSTIVIDSHDVGTYAWKISTNGNFSEVGVSKEMEEKSHEAFLKKYGMHSRH